ncbi:MAG TPA: proline dehydrogenase family protein [Candidatus Acidoferrum sp.]|nr:proline dehydrogenase family protein [Candidatus Acidoferrum sp.]
MAPTTTGKSPGPLAGVDLEPAVQEHGAKLLALMDAAEPPALFSKKSLYGALMDWAMRDEHFKTQLFRFVDVLPTLTSASEIARHLREYLGEEQVKLSPALRAGLKAAGGAGWLFGAGVKAQVTGMARQFMLGNEEAEIAATLRNLHEQGIGFTVDVLGEAVVSEAEADDYARRYLRLLGFLAQAMTAWPPSCAANAAPGGPVPALNVSVKISALYSQIHPADPDTAVQQISARLRPILRRAIELGAFINLDMESYVLKDLTLRVFKGVFSEPEFTGKPECGMALQTYLKSTEQDLAGIVAWAREHRRRLTVRLVKGAYWDYETVIAQQRGWPVPVFAQKAETDANFENLSLTLLENADAVAAAFGTHNVRSIACVLAQAERLNADRRSFEFQMLYGMADPLKGAVQGLGCRLREYCPIGELLPGMAYLVRRLLENTSNEGFLARKFAAGTSRDELLKNPRELLAGQTGRDASPRRPCAPETDVSARRPCPGASRFNEPPTDFTIRAERETMWRAIAELKRHLGQRYPLVIAHRQVRTSDWLASRNPANQEEVIGYAAQAGVAEAESALDAARAAQPAWAATPAEARASSLEKLATLLHRDKPALAALEILEAGKNWTEADADVAEAIDFCNFYARVMRALGRPQLTQAVAGETNFLQWWPRGVGVVIAPWNFPLAILTGMTAAAVVAGNAVIMKPSDQTPVIAARLMDLCIEAGLPPGVVNLLTGPGGTVGQHLVEHPSVDFIAFTGSREVGLKLWEAAGRTAAAQTGLKKVICEMGGKNCIIVDSDADLDEAVAGCITSAFGYQGQKCSALSRLIVLADNYQRFMDRLVAAAASLRVGPAEVPGNALGPVISREAQNRIKQAVEAAREEATLAWEGPVPEDQNACYVPATIFTDVPRNSTLFQEEIFGPVLAVTRATDFTAALALANDSRYALTGGCYSRSPAHLERARAELVCGNLYINRPITGAIVERQPFGGFRLSGGGTKAGGREYLQNFLVPRVVSENCLRRGFAPSPDV